MIPSKKGGRPTTKPSAEVLSMLYSSMTATEIAKQYNVAESTVRRWLCDYRKAERKVGD